MRKREDRRRISGDRIPITDALRVPVSLRQPEGFDNERALLKARDLGILILERKSPAGSLHDACPQAWRSASRNPSGPDPSKLTAPEKEDAGAGTVFSARASVVQTIGVWEHAPVQTGKIPDSPSMRK